MQEQEVNTNAAKKRREKDPAKEETLTESVGYVHKGMKSISHYLFLSETIRYVISLPETRSNCEGDISGDSEHRERKLHGVH